MTNQLASLAQRDYFYLDPFWSVNLGMYIINGLISMLFLLTFIEVRTLKFFSSAGSRLVNLNFRRASRMQGERLKKIKGNRERLA